MFLAHSIRLRDPWQCERTDAGAMCYTRTFHKPTGLEPDDDLWLVLSGLPEDAQVTVNDHSFTTRGRVSFATSDSNANEAPQSQKTPDPFPPGATGILPVPEAGTRTPETQHPSIPQSAIPNPQSPSLPTTYNLTPILNEKNQIQILLPPASGLQPAASLPFDARLAIMARS
jgi:hypothetical protein